MGKNKHPRAGVTVNQPQKIPRNGGVADAIRAKNFCWRLDDIDWEGQWGWSQATTEDLIKTIIPKLHHYESMTWADVEGPSGSHSVGCELICADARSRLNRIGKSELETLFSVRITGERRIWGVKDVAILRILWWDPGHSVYPVAKKNT